MPEADVQPSIALAWEPERAELVETCRILLRLRRTRRIATLLLGGAAVALGLALTADDVVLGVVSLLPLVALVAFLAVGPVHLLAAHLAWHRDPRARAPRTATVAPGEGVHVTVGDVSSTFRWSAFSGALETNRQYLLRMPVGRRTVVVPLPARGAAPGDRDRLRAVLAAELGEPVRTR